MERSEWISLDRPVHPNHFSGFQIPEEFIGNFMISPEGGIISVKRVAIKKILEEQEIKDIKYGITKAPKKMKIDSIESLYRLTAILADLEEI